MVRVSYVECDDWQRSILKDETLDSRFYMFKEHGHSTQDLIQMAHEYANMIFCVGGMMNGPVDF